MHDGLVDSQLWRSHLSLATCLSLAVSRYHRHTDRGRVMWSAVRFQKKLFLFNAIEV